jgi:hypothetical protein
MESKKKSSKSSGKESASKVSEKPLDRAIIKEHGIHNVSLNYDSYVISTLGIN